MTSISLTRTTALARWNAVLMTRNRLALLYATVLPLLPLGLLATSSEGAGAAAVVTTLTIAMLFPVYYNLLSQFVTRRDELVLKRLRTGETRDAELVGALALPGVVIAVAVAVVAVPVALAFGEPFPLNPAVYLATALVAAVMFAAFAIWTAAWTRNAEAAQMTSMPVIVLAVVGQMSLAFPESAQRWLDLTPGAAITDLVRAGWFGFAESGTERTLGMAETWTESGRPLLVLLAWTVVAVALAVRSLRWEPRD